LSIDQYVLYLMAVAVFFATPPDTSQLLVISNSIRYGIKRSKWTIAGDLTANIFQMTAAAFGLSAIIATSSEAFIWIKWFGVLYLVWIGFRLFLDQGASLDATYSKSGERLRLFRQGFATSLANPFAVVFFAALFPQFINTDGNVLAQLMVLGTTYLVVDGLILLAWGVLGIRAVDHLKIMNLSLVNKVCGALMIAAAGLLAAKDFEPQPR